MSTNKILSALLIFLLVLSIAGCSLGNTNQGGEADNPETDNEGTVNKDETVMDEFNSLIEKDPDLGQIIGFIDKNISRASKEEASAMIDTLESAQKEYLPELENKYVSEDIQSKFYEAYKPGSDLNDISVVTDEELQKLLEETRDYGYKVETSEGMYYPIINYDFYKKYSNYLTPDFKDYVDIMAVESNKVPAKDAALTIGWDEIVKRALTQEDFIEKYPDSKRADDITQLYKNYAAFIFFGTNNTPLFSYETNTIDDDAKAAYINALDGDKDSRLLQKLSGFLDILEKNGYKLTEEVDKYRREVLSSL